MKRNCTLLLILLVFSLSRTYAQKGSWFVGGQGGIGTSNSKLTDAGTTESSKSFGWNFSPEIGTFTSPNLQVGIGLVTGVSKNTNQNTPLYNFKTTNIGMSLFARRFWGAQAFKPFVGAKASYIRITNQSGNLSSVYNKTWSNSTSLSANLGFSYALSPRFTALGELAALSYSHSVNKPNSPNSKSVSNSFGFDAGANGNRFNIGFYYTFKK